MERQYWLYRTKPQDDEIFSSWLVRQAHGLAWKLQPFCARLLGQQPGFWARDVDKFQASDLLLLLSDKTVTPYNRSYQTTLASYEGVLWEQFHLHGPLPWIIPVGRYGRRRLRHGQQFCRKCLAEDGRPYFRKRWRLSCFVACEKHGVALWDACPHCGAPIEFHARDFGQKFLEAECPIVRCNRCGFDLREVGLRPDVEVPKELWDFQRVIFDAICVGWSDCLPGAAVRALLFFEGLRILTRLIMTNAHAARLRQLMLVRAGYLPFATAFPNRRFQFEELGIGDRLILMELVAVLLKDWPNEFVRLCRESRVSSSYILNYKGNMPYWLEAPVRWWLNDRYYAPTERERQSVRTFLARSGIPCTRNEVNRWLGVACRRPIDDLLAPRLDKWNPR